jgi:hypothetical protein
MTQDEIIAMLRASCDKEKVDPEQNGFWVIHTPELEAFAKLVAQRTWVGLTDNEMLECLKAVDVATAVNLLMSQYEMPPTFKVYAEAIEAKLKEKNT